jgi:hypothetical protein
MIEKKFIEDQSEVKQRLQELKLFQPKTEQFEEIYIDPKTNQKWEQYEFEIEYPINYGIGLRTFPYTTIDETIEIVLTSNSPDEVAGASALLFKLDRQGLDIRKPLLNSIEERSSEVSPDRFETIYWRTEIYDKTNNRKVIGKQFEEVKADSVYYIETADRAKELKEKITTTKLIQNK